MILFPASKSLLVGSVLLVLSLDLDGPHLKWLIYQIDYKYLYNFISLVVLCWLLTRWICEQLVDQSRSAKDKQMTKCWRKNKQRTQCWRKDKHTTNCWDKHKQKTTKSSTSCIRAAVTEGWTPVAIALLPGTITCWRSRLKNIYMLIKCVIKFVE